MTTNDDDTPEPHPEIRVAHLMLTTAAANIQDLVMALNRGEAPWELARKCLRSIELTDEAISRAKTPLRRLMRK